MNITGVESGPLYQTASTANYSLLKDFARSMRHCPTEAESILWGMIRAGQLGVKFRRQHIIGEYIADYVCLERKLIIELDGKYHSLPEQQIEDSDRQAWLEGQGYHVVRITNEELLVATDKALEKIRNALSLNETSGGAPAGKGGE